MKQLHRPDLFTWSTYHAPLGIDFNGFLWTRDDGNVLVDPLPLSADDEHRLDQLGGAAWIILTNSDHVRGGPAIAARTGARLAGPRGERHTFPVSCERWLGEGDEPFPGLVVHELEGSKTEGELALVLQDSTVVFGDLVRAHRADALMLLSPPKLRDRARALGSVRRVRARHPGLSHVLVGDGWCSFRHGGLLLDELLAGR
jgi:hypothetical protein